MTRFEARLSPSFRLYTAILIAAVGGAAAFLVMRGAAQVGWALLVLLGGLLLLGVLSVRGYVVGGGRLVIERFGWSTGIELSELAEASPASGVVGRSISLWSTRGLFGLIGYAYARGVGVYRAYVTDPGKAVVLRFRSGRRILVSPASPSEFLATVLAESSQTGREQAPN